MARKAKQQAEGRQVVISAPKLNTAVFSIRGTAPYVTNKFSGEAQEQMRAAMEAGGMSSAKKKRSPKDFAKAAKGSMHVAAAGWPGMPASSFRQAMISACRLVGFKMTMAKLSVFVEADGFCKDGHPLVKITKKKPHQVEHYALNKNGSTDIRARMMFDAGWEAKVRVKYDTEQFTLEDMANLMMRVGAQVGIGAGRPDSKMSAGMGWGTFEVTK